MISVPKYSKYERPDGYSETSPIVMVRKNVLRDVGSMPDVNYDGLEELFHRDLDIPTHITPKIKLYGGSLVKRAWCVYCGQTVSPDVVKGFHVPYTHTVHVNAGYTARTYDYETMRVTVHEAKHLADSITTPFRTAGEIATRWALMSGSAKIAEKSGFIPVGPAAMAARLGWYAIEPAELRAREAERSDIYLNHAEDIMFEHRSRNRF